MQSALIKSISTSTFKAALHCTAVQRCAQTPTQIAMSRYSIVPDVIPWSPCQQLKIWYDKYNMVLLGNELRPCNVLKPPNVKWKARDPDFHTLIMISPDAPCRYHPVCRHWLHWMVVNIPGSKLCCGETLVKYVGAGPPQNTGFHRYVFLLFSQPYQTYFYGEQKISDCCSLSRCNFNMECFLEKHDIRTPPIAGNFFQSRWDEHLPSLQEQFKQAKV